MAEPTDCYDHPEYWDMAFDEDTCIEADFVEAAATKYCPFPLVSVLEPGCGGGRLLVELAGRGLQVSGCDLSQRAVEYAKDRLAKESLTGTVVQADMRDLPDLPVVDVAYCFVNTFRHLLTEDDAVLHLKTVANHLRPGGLYLIGMHLLPPDADEEDEEEWSVTDGTTTIDMRLDVTSCDRTLRIETLRFQMDVAISDDSRSLQFVTEYTMRIYLAEQMLQLLAKVPEFELRDVYDFWYDIEEPLELSDELGDTVFILQRQA